MQIGPYLDANQIDRRQFAGAIGVTLTALYRYVAGDRFPTPETLHRIRVVTDGAVTADDFVNQHAPTFGKPPQAAPAEAA